VVIPPEEHGPANWCEDMVGALTRGTGVACDGHQGRRSVLFNQAIYECARSGKPVRIEERRATGDEQRPTSCERGGETRWS
jgi:hypothetical protein